MSRDKAMSRVLLRIPLAVAATLVLAQPSEAAVYGPVPDGFVTVLVPVTMKVPTHLDITIEVPFTNFGGRIRIGQPDDHEYTFNVPLEAILFSYVTITSTPADGFDLQTDDLILTDITGMALGGPTDLIATGFDPISPEVVVASTPTFEGISGTTYAADLEVTSTIAELGTLLPDFDLTGFSGDTSSIVYVSQFTVPASDFATIIPEPSTLAIWAFMTVGLFGHGWWRRRSGAWLSRR